MARFRLRPLPPLLRVLLAFRAPGAEATPEELARRAGVDLAEARALVALLLQFRVVEELEPPTKRDGAIEPAHGVLVAFGEEVYRAAREEAAGEPGEREIVNVPRIAGRFVWALDVLRGEADGSQPS